MQTETNQSIGNKSLVTTEEERMASFLKERNLGRTNQIFTTVTLNDTIYSRYVKRLLDIVISLIVCIVVLPLNLIFAICTFFDVGLPILYKQTRAGRNGKPFTLIKFRNMNNKTDSDGKLLPPSQRITKFGSVMRKYSLDELLNFWSVLKGDMSIIGPRPLPMFFHERMSDRHKCREMVRPGLECPRVFQIEKEGRYICPYHKQFENDIWYVEHVSFITDVKMIVLLIKMVFNTKKRCTSAQGTTSLYFVGYDDVGYALDMGMARQLYKEII